MLKIYRILWFLCLPIAWISLLIRIFLKKEDHHRIKEKLGIPSYPLPSKKVIWIHAVSVGESLSALTFIEYFQKHISNDFFFLLTTTTTSSASIIASKKIPNCLHQYCPLDHVTYVRRFLRYWKPSYVFFMESEIWPTIFSSIRCPLFLLNARLSERSFKKWLLFKPLLSQILSNVSLVMTQSKMDTSRLRKFSKNVVCTGNIKYASPTLAINEELYSSIKKFFTKGHCISAVSTHEGEESIMINALKKIREVLPKTFFIIAPRHPNRCHKVLEQLEQAGLKTHLRSQLNEIDQSQYIDTICLDSFGELGTVFSLSDFVFVGGSLVPVGGHNILEPIMSGKPVMFGNYMGNFQEIKNNVVENGAGFTVETAEEIADLFCRYILDKDFNSQVAKALIKFSFENPLEAVRKMLTLFIR